MSEDMHTHAQQDHDELTTRLSALDELPVEEHVAVYDRLHRELRDQLVDGAPESESESPPV